MIEEGPKMWILEKARESYFYMRASHRSTTRSQNVDARAPFNSVEKSKELRVINIIYNA